MSDSPEGSTPIQIKEVPMPTFTMRWADAGDPANIYVETDEVWSRDERTGIRTAQNGEIAVSPKFTEPLPSGSILSLGKDQNFEVTASQNPTYEKTFPNSVFVKRIPKDEYNRLKKELIESGKPNMVYDSHNLPLTDQTKQSLNIK